MKERNEEPETMKPIILLPLLSLIESELIIKPEDITAGQDDPAILICAGKGGGKSRFRCIDWQSGSWSRAQRRVFRVVFWCVSI